MKKIIITIIILISCGCKIQKSTELENIINSNNYIIIDVRTNEEYKESHLKGSINIPYDEINEDLDKNKTILVYCQSGRRSKIAYDKLNSLGFTVYDLGAFSEINLPKE